MREFYISKREIYVLRDSMYSGQPDTGNPLISASLALHDVTHDVTEIESKTTGKLEIKMLAELEQQNKF